MKLNKLIKAEIIMFAGEVKSYSLNYLFYNLGLLLIFIGIFFSVNIDGNVNSLAFLYGLISWQLCNSALSYVSGVIEDEAVMGTLEQIFMTRTKGIYVFIVKIFIAFIFNLAKAIVLFIICALVFDVWDVIYSAGSRNFLIVLITSFVVLSFGMLGLSFGGLSLFKKKIQPFLNMVSYVLLFFSGITSSLDEMPTWIKAVSKLLPLTWLQELIKSILAGRLIINQIVIVMALSILYSFLGYVTFKCFLNKARREGKLGHY